MRRKCARTRTLALTPQQAAPATPPFDLAHPALSFAVAILAFRALHEPRIATDAAENETAGACGRAYQDSDLFVALPSDLFDMGEHCGREVALRSELSGLVVHATVGDRVRPECIESVLTCSVHRLRASWRSSARDQQPGSR